MAETKADDYVAEEDFDEFDEDDDDDGNGGSKAPDQEAEELKNQALVEVRRAARQLREDEAASPSRRTATNRPTTKAQQSHQRAELMTIRFTVKTIERLCDVLRSKVDDVRRYERELRKDRGRQVRHAAEHFIKTFRPTS